MPPVFGPWSPSKTALWSWRGGQRHGVAPVAERDEADLFAGQKLLDHQAAVQCGEGGFGLRRVVRDDHAFARRQAIGLEDHGKAEASQRHARLRGVFDRGVGGGRNSSLHEKVLCENLAAFQLRRLGVRPDDAQAARAEGIHDAGHQRHFRSDHRQVRADANGGVQRVARERRWPPAPCPDCRGTRRPRRPRDCASFQHSACSRPPLPMTSIFIHRTMVAMPDRYDVVVIGAGHAGCEAARACARMGLRTAMVTMNLDLIAQMSCNPAIGGIAKGHLVREIDALGGVMGEVADAVGIQFRLLNTSRGPAVWSPRAQMDKKLYRVRMREVLESGTESAHQAGRGGGADDRCGPPRHRRAAARWADRGGGRGDRHHRDVPQWPGACRRDDVQLRAERRGAVAVAGRSTAHAGLELDAAEDRNSAAAGRPDHRLVAVRTAARRCRARRRSPS